MFKFDCGQLGGDLAPTERAHPSETRGLGLVDWLPYLRVLCLDATCPTAVKMAVLPLQTEKRAEAGILRKVLLETSSVSALE